MFKIALAASAAYALTATASMACAPEKSHALSQSITTLAQEIVAQNDAYIADVMAVAQKAAVTEYHAGPLAPSCARQVETLEEMTKLSQRLAAEETAMLAQDRI